MAEAAEGMRQALADIAFETPSAPLLANADAIAAQRRRGLPGRAHRPPHARRRLGHRRRDHGRGAAPTTFIEVGPGKVLTGLVRRIDTDATTIAIDDITTESGLELPV